MYYKVKGLLAGAQKSLLEHWKVEKKIEIVSNFKSIENILPVCRNISRFKLMKLRFYLVRIIKRKLARKTESCILNPGFYTCKLS